MNQRNARRTRVESFVRRLALFSCLPAAAMAQATGGGAEPARLSGFVSETVAYTTADPEHWSRGLTRLQVVADGAFSESVKWRLGGRIDFDPLIGNSGFYLPRVRDDQRFDAIWRENYIDVTAGDWAVRVGAQNIIWGEVAGLFFADVVSARDLRDFLLPSFDVIRIPQWAVRTEYNKNDSHFELVWVPAPSFDNIGKPGSDFYPVPLPAPLPQAIADTIRDPERPERKLSNSNYGIRAGTLVAGWDMALFYYRSFATSPTLYLNGGILTPRYDRLHQVGGTVTKDLGEWVVRAEGVYADGQRFAARDPSTAPEGVIERKTFDWIVSAETALGSLDGRANFQVFGRHYNGGDEALAFRSGEYGASVLLSAKLTPWFEPSLQAIYANDGAGSMVRPRVNFYPAKNLVIGVGVDLFSGDLTGLFGRFANRDRAYVEARFDF